MNWLDIVLLILIAGSVVSAFAKGMSREVLGFATVVAALLLGCWFYGSAGGWLLPYVSSRAIANFVGFLLVFCGVITLGGLAGQLVKRMMKASGLSFFDRLLGAAFGFARGMLVAVALVMAVMAFAPGRGAPTAVVNSRFAPYVLDAARVCADMAPYELKQGFRNSYQEVKSIWDGALRNGIRALPGKNKKENEREI